MSGPPQDCRSRGDCGCVTFGLSKMRISRLKIAAVAATAAPGFHSSHNRILTASRLPQSRRLRPADSGQKQTPPPPPQDCRSRGDCGVAVGVLEDAGGARLKIAAVAATAAGSPLLEMSARRAASRLPQSRRLRLLGSPKSRCAFCPPQDCRSRGDCGMMDTSISSSCGFRLKIAAVAATAASSAPRHWPAA